MEQSFDLIHSSGGKPLAAYLFTNNKKLKKKFVETVSAGGLVVNDTTVHVSLLLIYGIYVDVHALLQFTIRLNCLQNSSLYTDRIDYGFSLLHTVYHLEEWGKAEWVRTMGNSPSMPLAIRRQFFIEVLQVMHF